MRKQRVTRSSIETFLSFYSLCLILSDNELKEREPFVSSYKSLLVPEEGIVDYMGVMLSMKQSIINSNGDVFLNSKIDKLY